MGLLPPFLTPFECPPLSSPITYQNAKFTHSDSLGSSHVLWWPSRDAQPDCLLFFIPGNPGLVDFYIPFLSAIHSSHESSNLAIVAQSHLDHYPGIQNSENSRFRPEEGLTIQVQNALKLLESIDAFYKNRPRIIVIGHSVGCWISLQVLKVLPKDRIEATIMLFPTISNIGDTPNGRSLVPIFWPKTRSLLSSLSFITKRLPDILFRTIYPTWPDTQLHVLQNFISYGVSINASLCMAAEEMKTIRELDVVTLDEFKDRLYFFYAETDNWVGKEKDVVLQVFDPNNESTHVFHGAPGIPHAFCIKDSEPVAKQCCEWIDDILKS